MNWLTLVGSLGAVLGVALLVWLMGLGKSPDIIDGAQAMALAQDADIAFRPVEAIVDRNGKAALVAGYGGEMIALRAHGARIVARTIKTPPETQFIDGVFTIVTGEKQFGTISLRIDQHDATKWSVLLENARHA